MEVNSLIVFHKMWHHFQKLALLKPLFLDLMNFYCLCGYKQAKNPENFAEAGKLLISARRRIIQNSMSAFCWPVAACTWSCGRGLVSVCTIYILDQARFDNQMSLQPDVRSDMEFCIILLRAKIGNLIASVKLSGFLPYSQQ